MGIILSPLRGWEANYARAFRNDVSCDLINAMPEKPIIKTRTQFVDYLAVHIGLVRCLMKLSRKHAFYKAWDDLMGERWCSVINGRSPSPEQRRVALAERHNVNEILPLILPAAHDVKVLCHSLHAYICSIPAPENQASGWDLRADLIHPDGPIKMLNAAMDDVRCMAALDSENAYFKALQDQLIEMARWTRTSLNPTAEERAKVNLSAVTQADLEEQLKACVISVCRSMHDFCDLYATVPTGQSAPAMDLTPPEGWKKE